jgi:hypothetical protein
MKIDRQALDGPLEAPAWIGYCQKNATTTAKQRVLTSNIEHCFGCSDGV